MILFSEGESMKIVHAVLALGISLISSSSFAQSPPQAPANNDSPCRVMEVHCKCENPTKDFVIPRQKIGKTNPTDRGSCWSSTQVTNLLRNVPMTYCMKDDTYEKDPTKPQTKCSATWTCKESCSPSEITN